MYTHRARSFGNYRLPHGPVYLGDPQLGFSLKKAFKKITKVALAPVRLPLKVTKAVIQNPLNPAKQVKAVVRAHTNIIAEPFRMLHSSGSSAPAAPAMVPEPGSIPVNTYGSPGPIAPTASVPLPPGYSAAFGMPGSPMQLPGVPTSPENEAAALAADQQRPFPWVPLLVVAGAALFLSSGKRGRR